MKKEKDARKIGPTWMQLQLRWWIRILVSVGVMGLLVLLVYFFNIPNPNMILIAGLVLCSALFGFWGGGIAAAAMLVYTLYFFSTKHNFVDFTPENARKVIVSVVGIVVDMVLVCMLKETEIKTNVRVKDLTEDLRVENEKLLKLSYTDALTGVRNRMALDRDSERYHAKEVVVMMMDVDKFKHINDTYGHDVGDRILRETGALLSKYYGGDHCYRYGGDEFLVISELERADFEDSLRLLLNERPTLDVDGEQVPVVFSVGFVCGVPQDAAGLDDLVSTADERMYLEKMARRGGDTRR